MSLVLIDETGRFWTGSRWAEEYPDAMLYRTKTEAKRARVKAFFKASLKAVSIRIVENYGLAEEREILPAV